MSTRMTPQFLADLDERLSAQDEASQVVVLPPPSISGGSTPPPVLPSAALTVEPPPVVISNPIPWEQQPGESDTAYGRFRAFCEQGAPGPDGLPRPRSLTVLAERLGLAQQTIHGLSSRHQWASRVAAWDKRDRSGDFQADIHDLGRRMVRVAAASVSALEEDLAEGKNPLRRSDGSVDTRTLANVVQQMNQTLRLNAGLSTENASLHVNGGGAKGAVTNAHALAGAAKGSQLLRDTLRVLVARVRGESTTEQDERLAHAERLLKLFPFEKRADQDGLLKAAAYLQDKVQNASASSTA